MSFSVPVQTLLFFTALSFLPAILLMMTGFTRIVIVLSLMRQALGTQSSPPNQVIVGLSLFLTFFVMELQIILDLITLMLPLAVFLVQPLQLMVLCIINL